MASKKALMKGLFILILLFDLFYQRAYIVAYIIRPDNDGQNAFYKRQMQESDGKQPTGEPRKGGKAMIFYFDIFHSFSITFCCEFGIKR